MKIISTKVTQYGVTAREIISPALAAPPPPAADAPRPLAFYDTECYPNYWLLKFRPRGGLVYSFRLFAGQCFGPEEALRIRTLFDLFTTVSFHGNYYDVPQLTAALQGYTAEQLKWQNDRIIVDKVKPWELGLPDWRPADHIDVREVIPGKGGQKYKAGIIHYKTMRDLPYDPGTYLTAEQIAQVDEYCENDLGQLEALFDAVRPQIKLREALGIKYGLDLRSKSDAQVAEAVLKRRCEIATGQRIYKPDVDYNLQFRFDVPPFISYQLPQLQRALEIVRGSIFRITPAGNVAMPPELEGLTINIGTSTYKLGIGGLHSQEKQTVHKSDEYWTLRDNDVASYYPSLILNSGAWPEAMGQTFLQEYGGIKAERLEGKHLAKKLPKGTPEQEDAATMDSGGKIMLNGTFGKTLSGYSVLFAPKMGIQTTVSGQLSLLMLIEWHELYGIPVISANTDGIIVKCPRRMVHVSEALIAEWQKRTGLEMETVEYRAVYSRDINNYIAIKVDGTSKRKGEYAPTSLIMKKSPDTEICADAVAAFLESGVPVLYTISACRDLRKFVIIQNVAGGAVKMWGEGPRHKLVRDMLATLQARGWVKEGRQWRRGDIVASAAVAYEQCFAPQTPEYLGKVVRWYYSTQAPGPIVYATNGNTVSLSYGARPCMTLPDEFPDDIDYQWYLSKAEAMLRDLGYYTLT